MKKGDDVESDIDELNDTNSGVGSTLATSLIGISSIIPPSTTNDPSGVSELIKSKKISRLSLSSNNFNDETCVDKFGSLILSNVRRKSQLSLLYLPIPQPHSWSNFMTANSNNNNNLESVDEFNLSPTEDYYHSHHHHHHRSNHKHCHFPHIPVPTFTFTNDGSNRKLSFGIRRHSHMTLHRTDSMVSLCFQPLINFITEDNLAGLQNYLEKRRIPIDDRDENGTTALIFASSKGKLEFVRVLINYGADVNAEDVDNWTGLLCAAKEGYTEICMELLDHGANLEHRDMGGWSALMWSTYKNHLSTVKTLLHYGADTNAHGNYHISSLLWASGRGYSEIVKELLDNGAKVNMGDKYGTTALVWASRKGNIEIVDYLLKYGATVDTAGMYSWTALIVATIGNHIDVVMHLLDYKPNINALDKDGYTALAIASREGYHEIVNALLNSGAYINIQDRSGDTNLIHSVKGGHRSVVELLLKKYVDVDIAGKDKKTATYIAVEKNNISILKLLLNANPDLEIATKDGDTALLRAVRSRNPEIVQLLLDKKAKVTATDNKGDTVLHIAMRARSKAIVEILLRNPKNSQLLYRPNKQGETPYTIDIKHPKTILGQIFGARRLNTNEDNENMLGYDLYSSALADILSEPSLSTPITVGLYAKWGSGKSFLLNKLREEMKNFAKQWIDPTFQLSIILHIISIHLSLIFGLIFGLTFNSIQIGLYTGVSLFAIIYITIIIIWQFSKKYDWYWSYNFIVGLTIKLNSIKLLLQVIFCHPPGNQINNNSNNNNNNHTDLTIQPIKFYFTDQTRVGTTTTGGENAVVQMVGSLYDSIENDFGSLTTRLYRAFKPKSIKSTSKWTWRKLCCLPYFIVFEFCLINFLIGISVFSIYFININQIVVNNINNNNNNNNNNTNDNPSVSSSSSAVIILIIIGIILTFSIIANLYTGCRIFKALIFSQRRHLQRNIRKLDSIKSEGFIQTLKLEVSLMTDMVKCLDSFTAQQSRLVLIVDGLDSCEQDKVLLVLDAMQALFSDNNCPFIVILAIDPHIVAKAVEINSRRIFNESNIGGHDYLRNMVHVPFYLQNSGLRKVKIAQQTAQYYKKNWCETDDNNTVNYPSTSTFHHSISNRRLSTESSVMNSNEKLKPPSRKGSRKMRLSESIASSIGSNLNRLGGAQDLNKMLLTDDYFSDVNPRSMRRLMNVVYVTGRLLKAFQIDFNWYHLASWINITEQWPFRTSWLILHFETAKDTLDDSTSLKSLYDKIRPQIPVLKDVQPLLEIDRDERKLDVFLTFHRSSLLVRDMKIFLPFTINLDPYIKKRIKEEQQSMEEDFNGKIFKNNFWQGTSTNEIPSMNKAVLFNRRTKSHAIQNPSLSNQYNWPIPPIFDPSIVAIPHPWIPPLPSNELPVNFHLPTEISDLKLSSLTVENVCDLLSMIEELQQNNLDTYKKLIRENNVNGKVLLYCELSDLKQALNMAFGDWELFRVIILSLREKDLTSLTSQDETQRSVRFTMGQDPIKRRAEQKDLPITIPRAPTHVEKEKSVSKTDGPSRRDQTKHSIMEKQVTFEEQMICGALQRLNEEACEDVLDVPAATDSLSGDRPRSISLSTSQDTNYVILQPSPIYHWVPVHDEPESSDSSSQDSSKCLNSQPITTTITSTTTNTAVGCTNNNINSSNSSRSSSYSNNNNSSNNSNNNKNKNMRKSSTNSRPSSLLISPTASPRPAYRSKSTDEYPANNKLSSNYHQQLQHYSTPVISDDTPTGSNSLNNLDNSKFGKYKDHLINTTTTTSASSSPASPNQINHSTILIDDNDSEDESTPLVSEISTSSHNDVFSSPVKSLPSIDNLPHSSKRFNDLDYYDSLSLVIQESKDHLLPRQNAQDLDNPETTL